MTKREAKRLYLYCIFALLAAAMILGLSFVAQKAGMEYVGPFTFNTLRCFIGSLFLAPFLFIFKKEPEGYSAKNWLTGGVLTGLVLFFAFSINQYCMIYADAGKAGFLTALYIIFVPVLSVFFKQKLPRNVMIALVFALTGVYLLCAKGGFSFELWDIFLVVSAFFFALHIIVVAHFTKKVSALRLSCLQFLVAGSLSLPLMLMEHPSLGAVLAGYKPILFIGVVVTGVAYTLQIFGQKGARPVAATLLLSSESVFAVLGGMLLLGETLTGKEIAGCLIMACAIVLSQLRRLN